MPECLGNVNFTIGYVNSCTHVPDLASAFFQQWKSLLLWASWSYNKETPGHSQYTCHSQGLARVSTHLFIIFPTCCICVSPIVIDLINSLMKAQSCLEMNFVYIIQTTTTHLTNMLLFHRDRNLQKWKQVKQIINKQRIVRMLIQQSSMNHGV